MKMRELEARTGVNRETIRVYLRHGLVPEPSRPKRNVADYNEEHLRAVLAVRELQRESRLTLPQIAEVMQGRSLPRRIEASAFQHLEQLVAARVGLDERLVSAASLVGSNPHAESDARALAAIGALTLIEEADGVKLSLIDARLVSIWGEMRAAGFGENVNFKPEILEFYVRAAEYVAGNEAAKFLERTEGRMGDDEAAAMLQVGLSRMLDFFGLLRLKIFMRNIHREEPLPVK